MNTVVVQFVHQYIIFLTAAGVLFVSILILARRFVHRDKKQTRGDADTDLFALGALETVIRDLKKKEKKLESLRLHEQNRAEDSMALSENIIHSISSGVFTFNRSGQAVKVNLAASDVFLRKREDLLGIHYEQIFACCRSFRDIISTTLDEGRVVSRAEVEVERRDGDLRYLGVSTSPLKNRQQEIIGAVCLFTDLTEVRRLQQQVLMRENLSRLGEMSAGIAHEFKNSLAAIQGYARLVTTGRSPGQQREFAGEILEETKNLAKVVDDFLAFARPASLRFSRVDLGHMFRDCVEEIRRQRDGSMTEIRLEGKFPLIQGDETLLRQAMLNLLRNAYEAVDISGRDDGRVTVTARLGTSATAEIEVADNGIGVEENLLEKIFLPFFTTRDEGVGLGLALVQKILVSHDGSIRIVSEPGKGSRFLVTLPLTGRACPSGM